MGGILKRFEASRGGGAAVVAAFVLPVVAFASGAALELTFAAMDRSALQDAADAAALSGAKALTVADQRGVVERTRQFALSAAEPVAAHAEVSAAAEIVGEGEGVTVSLSARRNTFITGMMASDVFRVSARATAMRVGSTPLCVLAHGDSGATLQLQNRSRIAASACLVHANGDIAARNASRLNAERVQAAGTARGAIAPRPQVGAEPIADPFADRDLTAPGVCSERRTIVHKGAAAVSLPPGLHCDDLVLEDDATLTLQPGEHWFVGSLLSLNDRARLEGDDVVLLFDHAAFEFLDRSRVRLSARSVGALAGFLVVGVQPQDGFTCGLLSDTEDLADGLTLGLSKGLLGGLTRAPDGQPVAAVCRALLGSLFVIASDRVQTLQGVVYVPASTLAVTGTGTVADQSDWTVMVAKAIEVRGSPTLVINADYASSEVPVPTGVGPTKLDVRLTR